MNCMECCAPRMSRGHTPAHTQEDNPTWDLSRWMGKAGPSISLWGHMQTQDKESAADVLQQLRHRREQEAETHGATPRRGVMLNFHRKGTTMWANLEIENTGRHKAMVVIDIKGEPTVRSCSHMFSKEFGSSHPGPVGEPFFATVFGPGSDKIEIKKVRSDFSKCADVEVLRILVYCKSGPRMAAINFKSLEDNHSHRHDHYLAYFDFVEGKAESDLVLWWVSKNGFSQYDARRSQVEGRDMESMAFKEQMHTRVLLNKNESLNAEHKQRLYQDPALITHAAGRNNSTTAIPVRTICVTNARAGLPPERMKEYASSSSSLRRRSSTDAEGAMRLAVTGDLANPSAPQDIGPGLQKLREGKRRSIGQQKELEYFGAPGAGERLSPRALSDLEGVRKVIKDSMSEARL